MQVTWPRVAQFHMDGLPVYQERGHNFWIADSPSVLGGLRATVCHPVV